MHIHALEMMAAENALRLILQDQVNVHTVHLRMDNTTAVSHINKMGCTKSTTLTQLTKNIWEFCLQKRIRLTAEYIPGVQNQIADWESRHNPTSTNNWKLNSNVFHQIVKQWGPIELDLFADRQNAQTPAYISWKPDPKAIGTDAFMTLWKGRKAYAFPPFCLIPRCLAKLQREGGDLVIITPTWQTGRVRLTIQCYWKCQWTIQSCSLPRGIYYNHQRGHCTP